jgi:hypothetical protein
MFAGLRYVTIERFAELSGYTPDAQRSKIKRGDWLEGAVWIKAPDGRILIDLEGYERWVIGETGLAAATSLRRPKAA